MFDVVVVGSANLDLVARTPRLPRPGETVLGTDFTEHPGGKGLNQAVAAARSGATTSFVGAVGRDAAGPALLAVMTEEGIDTSRVEVLARPTGRALISVDDEAENCIVVVPGANAAVAGHGIPDGRVVLAQLEVPLASVERALAEARARGATTILNPAPAVALPDELLRWCDVVVPNEHECELLGGAEAVLARGVSTVVVTRGAEGVEIVTGDGRRRHQPPFDVSPVDTTAAGDAFCGALAARLAAGAPLVDAVRWAAAAGALATTVAGAVPSLPRATAIAALLSGAAPAPPSPPG